MKIAIIGSGSAGMTAAYNLIDKDVTVDMFEKGNGLESRNRNEVMEGFGGAGAYSDGKLTLTTEYGGWLTDYMPERELEELIKEADDMWKSVSGVLDLSSGADYEATKNLQYECSKHGLRLYPAKIRHLGTDNCLLFIERLYEMIKKAENINLFCNANVTDLIVENDTVKGIELNINGISEKRYYDKVIAGVGRSGNAWMQDMVRKYSIKNDLNPVDIGVRVEVPRAITDKFTNNLYEFKIKYYTSEFEDEVRTFCVNPGGFISIEKNTGGLLTVNGHSYKNRHSDNTNFALLVSTKFTEPFDEPLKYGRYIANLSNMLAGGDNVIVQRYGDFVRGRRSTESRIRKNFVRPTLNALPGDLSFVLPYRYLHNLRETIEQLDKVMPGMADPNTLMYGVEVKFYSVRIKVDKHMRAESLENLYCTGDGAGLTRGIIQASVSGLIAAKDILQSK
ncbi:FAD dependent oxidoreductase [Denitrovibrio acetiphilus DSM 12809]|uniref:FAD dependent oxidoreductase n=1 Tax=Denitrovibrio acetiphilus (strain DSM 12809 / NBRC 114555 / N2460) TaxID=522772 RepID=D4H3T0_DENA2|nr:NAD(P)-binding protein [Denitrovibrio acetiphilus]ADD69182.1 FAD dependent oxidoreductase [Denitrovibrio acetiphilus DSM 12809]